MATFECETNEPFVKVKWLKNNMEIFSGDKYRMHSDRKVHFLSVLIIDMRDDAEFTCMVVDDPDVRTTGKLNVEGGLAVKQISVHYYLPLLFLVTHDLCVFVTRSPAGDGEAAGEHRGP